VSLRLAVALRAFRIPLVPPARHNSGSCLGPDAEQPSSSCWHDARIARPKFRRTQCTAANDWTKNSMMQPSLRSTLFGSLALLAFAACQHGSSDPTEGNSPLPASAQLQTANSDQQLTSTYRDQDSDLELANAGSGGSHSEGSKHHKHGSGGSAGSGGSTNQ
jgi:hypothetical protein